MAESVAELLFHLYDSLRELVTEVEELEQVTARLIELYSVNRPAK